jgi:hypothetical protein
VEVGVIEQSLLQAQLKDSTQLNMVDVPMWFTTNRICNHPYLRWKQKYIIYLLTHTRITCFLSMCALSEYFLAQAREASMRPQEHMKRKQGYWYDVTWHHYHCVRLCAGHVCRLQNVCKYGRTHIFSRWNTNRF